jgi:hypothetical protein
MSHRRCEDREADVLKPTLEGLGLEGISSPAGSCAWRLVGLHRSVREWPVHQSCSRRNATLRLRPRAAADGRNARFLFGTNGQRAGAGRRIEHSDVVGPFASLFDQDALRYLPMWLDTHHLKLPVTPKGLS